MLEEAQRTFGGPWLGLELALPRVGRIWTPLQVRLCEKSLGRMMKDKLLWFLVRYGKGKMLGLSMLREHWWVVRSR